MEDKTFKEIKINRSNPNNIFPIHVNDMMVNQDGKEFFLQFLEIEPPSFLEIEELNKLESVDATMKVKLVMSPEFFEAMIKALTESLQKFKIKKEN
jgi:hypothetical protein